MTKVSPKLSVAPHIVARLSDLPAANKGRPAATRRASTPSAVLAPQPQPNITEFKPRSAFWFRPHKNGPFTIVLSDQRDFRADLLRWATGGANVQRKGVYMSLEAHPTWWGERTDTLRGRPISMQADPSVGVNCGGDTVFITQLFGKVKIGKPKSSAARIHGSARVSGHEFPQKNDSTPQSGYPNAAMPPAAL